MLTVRPIHMAGRIDRGERNMQRNRRLLASLISVAAFTLLAVAGAQALNPDALVTGSPSTPFPQSKQNEPSLAVNPVSPNILAAGANDELDLEACRAGDPTSCPFTEGVGVSGVYFSLNGGTSWVQPTYTGWSARNCLGPAPCVPGVGPIGTLPKYYENGLVSDGDPAVAFGPRRGTNGTFSWANGTRLYYANLTANFSTQRDERTFSGFEAIAVSRTDNVAAAAAGNASAWLDPVIVSKQNAALFSDHEQIAVDDAESSPFFGNVYVCNAAFRSQEKSPNALPDPIVLNYSSDGGDTWGTTQLSAATNNLLGFGRQDCQVNTDSKGTVYVFWQGGDPRTRLNTVFMARSSDGGKHFERPPRAVTTFDGCGLFEPVGGTSFDGLAGARDGSFPSVDIANGASTGAGATDRIVLTFCDGPTPSTANPGPNEEAIVEYSTNGGDTWTRVGNAAQAGDRPDFPAIAISPDGQDVYLTYDGFLVPWQTTTANPRPFQGVVRHADFATLAAFSTLHRGAVGDARGSSANSLGSEFLGDYNYAVATNEFGAAVWNDGRAAADCPAVDAYRQSLSTSTPIAKPAPGTDCPATFGNTDIFSGTYPDPTP
jgi:hypothetical protein